MAALPIPSLSSLSHPTFFFIITLALHPSPQHPFLVPSQLPSHRHFHTKRNTAGRRREGWLLQGGGEEVLGCRENKKRERKTKEKRERGRGRERAKPKAAILLPLPKPHRHHHSLPVAVAHAGEARRRRRITRTREQPYTSNSHQSQGNLSNSTALQSHVVREPLRRRGFAGGEPRRRETKK